MSNSIPGKLSFPALLAADKEEELELSGGSTTPVQSERSLSFGDYYDFAEVNSLDVVVKKEEADENADGVVTSALMIQPAACLNIGGSGDVHSTAAATAEVNSAAAAAARSSSERRAKVSRAKAARKLERKQLVEMRLRGTLQPGSSFGSQSVQRG